MIPDGKTVSNESPLTVTSSITHPLLPGLVRAGAGWCGLVQAGANNVNTNIPVHYKPIHWLQ